MWSALFCIYVTLQFDGLLKMGYSTEKSTLKTAKLRWVTILPVYPTSRHHKSDAHSSN